jgi:hypothetical protein
MIKLSIVQKLRNVWSQLVPALHKSDGAHRITDHNRLKHIHHERQNHLQILLRPRGDQSERTSMPETFLPQSYHRHVFASIKIRIFVLLEAGATSVS